MSLVLFLITAIALTLSLIRETLKRGSDSVSFTIWKFFSYYTTLSNILVLIWFAALAFCLLGRKCRKGDSSVFILRVLADFSFVLCGLHYLTW